MASPNDSSGNGNLLSYSNYIWNRLHSNVIIDTLSNLFRLRKRWECFPLPLSSRIFCKPSSVHRALEDFFEHVLKNLHRVEKDLKFWENTAKRSNSSKSCFMVLERGPRAFIHETFHLLRGASTLQQLSESAYTCIDNRETALKKLRNQLAALLAQVYIEGNDMGEGLANRPERQLPSLLVAMKDLLTTLEASIGNPHAIRQSNTSVGGTISSAALYDRMQEINQEEYQLTDHEIGEAINHLYRDLHTLDDYVSIIVTEHKKPRTQYWIYYSCGVVGLSMCSIWLVRHGTSIGISDNWIRDGKDSIIGLYTQYVEKPLLSIIEELFETSQKKHEDLMEEDAVQLTSNSLHRMLLALSKKIKGGKLPEDSSDLAMLEIVMARYEKELTHPIQGFLGGDLAQALLIQVQKLKLDIESVMLMMNQIVRANKINLAILPALPAFFLSLLLMMGARRWFKKVGRGKIAGYRRRQLLSKVDRNRMQYINFAQQQKRDEAQYTFGLLLYNLNRLCNSVKGDAEACGDWQELREDVISLARPELTFADQVLLVSRLRNYDCLLPRFSH